MTANPLSTIPPIGPTTGMTPPPMGGKFKPVDPVKLLRQHAVMLSIVGLIGLIVGGGIWYAIRTLSPQYTSEAKLQVIGQFTDPNRAIAAGTESSQLEEIKAFIANQSARISSDDVLRETIGWPTVQNSDWYARFGGDVRRASEALQKDHLKVGASRGSTLIDLSMTMDDPDDAQQVLEALITIYLQQLRIENESMTSRISSVFTREKERAEDQLNSLQNEIKRFISTQDMATLTVQQSSSDIEYQILSKQQVDLALQLDAANAAIAGLQQAAADPQRAVGESEEMYLRQVPTVMKRDEEVRMLREEISTMLEMGKAENHPLIRQLQFKMSAVEKEMQSARNEALLQYRNAQLSMAQQQAEAFKAQYAEIEAKARAAHEKMKDLTQKLQTFQSLEANIERTQERIAEADKALNDIRAYQTRPEAVRVSRHVNPTEAELTWPWKPYMFVPMTALLMVGGVGGLLFLRELMDQRVKSPADLKLLPDVALLGIVPDACEDPSGQACVERVVEEHPTGLLAESYRQVRTAVLSKMDRRGYKTLVMVSAQPDSGTSTLLQNLAGSLAFNGRNVLIVDANFRRPGQHALADIGNERGLVDVLRDEAELADVVWKHPKLSLSVLPTGQAGEAPPELLEGSTFRGLLSQMETEYDLVIIDAPPALLTSDSQLLAKHVDAIAVVVRANRDQRGMIERLLGKLDGQRADVLGVILNGVRSSAGGYFRKSYEQFYSYRGGAEPSGRSTDTLAEGRGRRAAQLAEVNGNGKDH